MRLVKQIWPFGKQSTKVEFEQKRTDVLTGHVQSVGMSSDELIEKEAVKVPCPTCGAGPGMRCELASGGLRRQSHVERRLIASDKVKSKVKFVT